MTLMGALAVLAFPSCKSDDEPLPAKASATEAPTTRSSEADTSVMSAHGTMRFGLDRQVVSHVALSKKDYLDPRESTLDYDITLSPVASDLSGYDVYRLKADINVHNAPMYAGDWHKKHGLVSVHMQGYLLERLDCLLYFGCPDVRVNPVGGASLYDPWTEFYKSNKNTGSYLLGVGLRDGGVCRFAFDGAGLREFKKDTARGPLWFNQEYAVANWIFDHKRNSCPLMSDDCRFEQEFTVIVPKGGLSDISDISGQLLLEYFSVDRTTLVDGNVRRHSDVVFPDGDGFVLAKRP